MMPVDILISVILLSVCGYAFVSDILTGKIRNIMLIISGSILLVLTLVKFVFIDRDDLFLYFQNAGTVLLLGTLGYIIRLWAGGDCKLIIVVALFYPTIFCVDYNQNRYTLWLILIIAFVLSFFYLLVDSVLQMIKGNSSFNFGQTAMMLKKAIIAYLKSFVYLTALNQVYSYFIYPYFPINSILYFAISILFVFGVSKIKLSDNICVICCFALFDLVMMVISHNFVFITYWKNYLLIFIFMVLRVFMSLYNYKVIKTNEAKEGMVISRIDTLLMHKSRVQGLPDISDESLKSKLTIEEAESVRRWEKSKYGKSQISIVRKIPFAAFISAGVFIYFLTGVLQVCGLI